MILPTNASHYRCQGPTLLLINVPISYISLQTSMIVLSQEGSQNCSHNQLPIRLTLTSIIYNLSQMFINLAKTKPTTLIHTLPLYQFSHRNQKKHFFKVNDQQPNITSLVYPKQYPTNLVDSAPLIHRGRPVRFITPKDEIPQLKMMSHDDSIIKTLYNDNWKSPENAYKLNVGLIGPINSGKSQLLAKLSHKVSAISPKRNTTDQVLNAFKSFQIQSDQGIKNIQLKYFDTPGLTHNKTGYLSKGWKVLGQIDFSLLVIDSSKKFDDLLQQSISRLQKHRNYENFMKALVLNKIDLVQNKRKFHGLISQIQRYGKFDKIFYTSATTGYGIPQIQEYLLSMAKKGQWEHPKEAKTESTQVQILQQMIKQALYHRTYNQVPYNILIECQSVATKSDGVNFAQFRIMVEDQNVQRMVIGKKGQNINWVRDHFKTNYAKIYGKEVEVHVRVVIRRKTIMRQSQEIQSSYYKQKVQKEMEFMKEQLQKEGKMLK